MDHGVNVGIGRVEYGRCVPERSCQWVCEGASAVQRIFHARDGGDQMALT